MKIVYCSWCDLPADYKTRALGEVNNSDACCAEHYRQYFAKHRGELEEYATLQVRVLWEGSILERKFFGEFQPDTADTFYSYLVDKYNRHEDGHGVTVQLIEGDNVVSEDHIS